MAVRGSERMHKHRDKLRQAGLRPVQIWIPDTRRPGFADECARQAATAAMTDRADPDLMDDLEAVLVDHDE